MEHCFNQPGRLAMELTELFNLEINLDTALSITMYKLSQMLDSERSSIFLVDPARQQLYSYTSLDLERREVRISKSFGVAGWVYENCQPLIVNNAYADSRFYKGVDRVTGFRTHNIICTPLVDNRDLCLGTMQSLNKRTGGFTTEDLELLGLTARLVTLAIHNSRLYNELRATNAARGRLIRRIVNKAVNYPA